MSSSVQDVLSELRAGLSRIYGSRLERLLLFGSQARGDSQPSSDVDVLVVLSGPVRPGEEIERTGELGARLTLAYNLAVSLSFVSAERFQSEQSPFLMNVRRECVPV